MMWTSRSSAARVLLSVSAGCGAPDAERVHSTDPSTTPPAWCAGLDERDAGQIWYVDSGVESAGDGSPESPFATISEAVVAAVPFSEVRVRAGEYVERVVADDPSWQRGLRIRACEPGVAVSGTIQIRGTPGAALEDVELIGLDAQGSVEVAFAQGVSLDSMSISGESALRSLYGSFTLRGEVVVDGGELGIDLVASQMTLAGQISAAGPTGLRAFARAAVVQEDGSTLLIESRGGSGISAGPGVVVDLRAVTIVGSGVSAGLFGGATVRIRESLSIDGSFERGLTAQYDGGASSFISDSGSLVSIGGTTLYGVGSYDAATMEFGGDLVVRGGEFGVVAVRGSSIAVDGVVELEAQEVGAVALDGGTLALLGGGAIVDNVYAGLGAEGGAVEIGDSWTIETDYLGLVAVEYEKGGLPGTFVVHEGAEVEIVAADFGVAALSGSLVEVRGALLTVDLAGTGCQVGEGELVVEPGGTLTIADAEGTGVSVLAGTLEVAGSLVVSGSQYSCLYAEDSVVVLANADLSDCEYGIAATRSSLTVSDTRIGNIGNDGLLIIDAPVPPVLSDLHVSRTGRAGLLLSGAGGSWDGGGLTANTYAIVQQDCEDGESLALTGVTVSGNSDDTVYGCEDGFSLPLPE